MKRTIVLMLVLALGGVAGVAKADFVFGTPTNLGSLVNNADGEGSPCISADGLSLYFTRIGSAGADIYVTQRASASDPWGEPVKLGPAVNSSSYDGEPSISSDGLSLYFGSQRPDGYGGADIWVATRATISDPWENAVNLGPIVNTPFDDVDVCISADGLSLYIDSFREGGHGGIDLWVATRESPSDPWGEPVNLGTPVNASSGDSAPGISADGNVLFFSDFFDPRPGGQGQADIWMTRRATASDPWAEPVNLGPAVNTSALDAHPNISTDGSTLYFASSRPGSAGFADLWQVSITPVVDFNGDGKVDGKEVLAMAQHWGEDYPPCDIAPFAWGDGVVDFEDLKVLAEYIGKEVVDGTLIAHWKLDETEGTVAADSAGDNNGTVGGLAVWRPDDGKVGGALEFDGVDDFVLANSPAGLGESPFSVCVWIKNGAPGQAIASPQGGVKWLYTNPIDGSLMTDLSASARAGTPLFSDVVVTDGQWHRVVLVWDGTNRILCVDDTEVAREPLSKVSVPAGKLIIGAGGSLEPASRWSGLIDDVRIYNRAVKP